MFAELTVRGRPVHVNPAAVAYLAPFGGKNRTEIYFNAASETKLQSVIVDEPINSVRDKLVQAEMIRRRYSHPVAR